MGGWEARAGHYLAHLLSEVEKLGVSVPDDIRGSCSSSSKYYKTTRRPDT